MSDINTMELKIAKFLRGGVILSGIIIAIGWAMSFKAASDPFIPLQTYSHLNLVDSIQMQAILQNWGKIIAYFGLTILISLPVIRVFLSILLFIKQKEKAMAILGTIVLFGLILSFSLGIEA